ncbi:MFS transporter [uncultured Phenylobacterium sp.]|uniref:MFS transporter n=1 Tax=uncultured Phenylobacterium sp. TaxID=349273 RepID=UPI0025CBE530|nr:MFS transporter [uncultured Phenylobacterium sp.]
MASIAGDARAGPPARHVAAVVSGNALEFYDFLTYAYFAVQIGRTFFPSNDPTTSLLASLATFGAGFLTRPLGALVIGRLADRLGRKPAMLLSFGLMGAAMLGIAVTPSYAAIGMAAPIVVIILRMIQGFALGGELGSSTAYLMEAAPPGRRGFFVSLQYVGQEAASFAAGAVGVVLATLLSAAALDAWGWRVAFLLGGVIIPIGLMLRHSLEETLHQPAPPSEAPPSALNGYVRLLVCAFMILAAGTTVSYMLTYLSTYAQATLGLPANVSLGATVASGGAGMVFSFAGGVLSDRFGRKPMMIIPWIGLLAVALPCYWLMNTFKAPAVLYGATFLISALASLATTSNLVAITESLPRRTRAGSLALVYALAISVFGGGAQFFATWLIKVTGSPMAPAWYMTTAVGLGLVAMVLMKESAPGRASAVAALAPASAA